MEDIAGVDAAPDDVIHPALPRKQPDARLVFRIPGIGKFLSRKGRRDRERNRQIEYDHIVLRDRAVMDRGAVLHGDGQLPCHLAGRIENHMPDRIWDRPLIGDGVKLSSKRVQMRMG